MIKFSVWQLGKVYKCICLSQWMIGRHTVSIQNMLYIEWFFARSIEWIRTFCHGPTNEAIHFQKNLPHLPVPACQSFSKRKSSFKQRKCALTHGNLATNVNNNALLVISRHSHPLRTLCYANFPVGTIKGYGHSTRHLWLFAHSLPWTLL